ncbi:MAG: glycoside hydrolase family 127 protein [Caldilineaceae bacterium]|nr:glycoside hydrolase family 127 protein [Caldilineaceae bacterium]
MGEQPVQVRLTSNYPWDGAIKLALTLDAAQSFALNLRIPGWCDEWSEVGSTAR